MGNINPGSPPHSCHVISLSVSSGEHQSMDSMDSMASMDHKESMEFMVSTDSVEATEFRSMGSSKQWDPLSSQSAWKPRTPRNP